jgi:hypothetical protein
MRFCESLERHLSAIQRRDLGELRETLSRDGMILITSDGRLVRNSNEFLDMHRDWFSNPAWSLKVETLSVREGARLALAVLKLDYSEPASEKPAVHQSSYLTLVFAQRNGRWELILDQNTPCRNALT